MIIMFICQKGRLITLNNFKFTKSLNLTKVLNEKMNSTHLIVPFHSRRLNYWFHDQSKPKYRTDQSQISQLQLRLRKRSYTVVYTNFYVYFITFLFLVITVFLMCFLFLSFIYHVFVFDIVHIEFNYFYLYIRS